MGCALQENKKAEKLFNQASSIFQKANTIEWKEMTKDKSDAIKKLDEAIRISPNWWIPYREKIQILLIGSWEDNSESVKDVYDLWLKNGNALDGDSLFSYGCSLFCCGKESEAIEIFEKFYINGLDKEKNDSEKILFFLSGIMIGEIDKENLERPDNELFNNLLSGYFENFLSSPDVNKKDILWTYAGL